MMGGSYRIGDGITLIPRGGRWHCRFQVGRRRVTRTTQQPLRATAKAEARARELREEALLRSQGKEPCPTLQEAFRLWVEHPVHVLRKSPSHLANMERCGRLHLGELAHLRLFELTTKQVEDELGRFLQTHRLSSGNQWITYLRIVCRWAVRRGMITAMPFEVPESKIRKKLKPLIPTEVAADWLEEVKALTEHEPAIYMVLALMFGMGLRGSEARAARWEWLDLERGIYTPGDTKGGEAWARPVPEWLLAILRDRAQPTGWMTPTQAGRPATPGRVGRIFHLACEAVGLPRMVPHRIRATYATWLSEQGVPIQDIQAALGHKDIRTTAIYLGIDIGRIASAQRRIAERTGVGGRKSGAGEV